MFCHFASLQSCIPAQKRETRLILMPVACVFGYDPLERPYVLSFVCTLDESGSPHSRSHHSGIRAVHASSRFSSRLRRQDLTGQLEPLQAAPLFLPFRPTRKSRWASATGFHLFEVEGSSVPAGLCVRNLLLRLLWW